LSNELIAEEISKLDGRQAVRLRPTMYLGDKDENGLHQLVYELVAIAIQEYVAGFGKRIQVTIHADDSVSVKDEGRGLPVSNHPTIHRPLAELLFSSVQAAGIFDPLSSAYESASNGGLFIVSFLSEWLHVTVHRDGEIHKQEFNEGIPTKELTRIGVTNRTGTTIHFKPDPTIFTTTIFKFDKLATKFWERAALNKGFEFTLIDEREANIQKIEILSKHGLADLVSFHCSVSARLYFEPIHLHGEIPEANLSLEFAFLYADQTEVRIYTFANKFPTPDGGTHLDGFYAGLEQAVIEYVHTILNKSFPSVAFIRKGLVLALAVSLPNPSYSDSRKTSINSEISGEVQSFVYQKLMNYFNANPEVADKIIKHLWREN
jgi:DNA gyrase subunit B